MSTARAPALAQGQCPRADHIMRSKQIFQKVGEATFLFFPSPGMAI